MGHRMLTGMDAGETERSVRASSTRWRMLSPMPIMPPLHTSKPSSRAMRMVASLLSTVCVVHSVGKNDGAVSRLQW